MTPPAKAPEMTKTRAPKTNALTGETTSRAPALREQKGVGAALLRARQCGGCQLTLDASEISRIKAAPADEVIRCEECQRILVRTDESGL